MQSHDHSQSVLLSVAEMAAADRAAIAAGTTGAALMERAGRAIADAVSRRLRAGESVLVICGLGHNGGDGFVAARLLRERSLRVTLALQGGRDAIRGDAVDAAARWPGPVEALDAVEPADYALVVDALFGAGLNRPINGDAAALIERVNAAGTPVVAVDVPSGLSGDTGQAAGPVIAAAETVTFFRLKPGHLLHPGRALCGVVTLADIGIAPDVAFGEGRIVPTTFRNDAALWRDDLPAHAADTHKYRRGAVLVVAGGLAGVGAPRLSARAALRAGAGLVTIACRPDAWAAHASQGPNAVMQKSYADDAALAAQLGDRRLGAVVAGPALGLDASGRSATMAVLRSSVPAVLDADALTLLSGRVGLLARMASRRSAPCVLTPHEGEFQRLFGMATGSSKLDRAREAARLTGCIIVLKGPDTVIAGPDGRAAINTTGSAALATAGSGDVLAGLIAGLLAQGMPAWAAACAAVHFHGLAGEALGMGLIADDLPDAIPAVMAASTAAV